MRKEELGAGLVGALIGAALIFGIASGTGWFASNPYSNAASNLLGIVAGPSLIAALAMGAWRWWSTRCAVRACLRTGEHPVDDCTAKVCSSHHTLEHHRLVFAARYVEGVLGWGKSHRGES